MTVPEFNLHGKVALITGGNSGIGLGLAEGLAKAGSDVCIELVEMGSAGAKTAAVIRGEADVYVHSGGQYEWDSAAPSAVATAAGLHVSTLDGEVLRYNQPNPFMPDILV